VAKINDMKAVMGVMHFTALRTLKYPHEPLDYMYPTFIKRNGFSLRIVKEVNILIRDISVTVRLLVLHLISSSNTTTFVARLRLIVRSCWPL
jgi:hypothetical protein